MTVQVRFDQGLYPVQGRQLNPVEIFVGNEANIKYNNCDWGGAMKTNILVPRQLVNWLAL